MNKRILSILLSLCLCISLIPASVFAAEFSDWDKAGAWSREALQAAVDNGLLQGSNGKLNPKGQLSRAEMAAVVTRAFGASEESDISAFTDLAKKDWYYGAICQSREDGNLHGRNRRQDEPKPGNQQRTGIYRSCQSFQIRRRQFILTVKIL